MAAKFEILSLYRPRKPHSNLANVRRNTYNLTNANLCLIYDENHRYHWELNHVNVVENTNPRDFFCLTKSRFDCEFKGICSSRVLQRVKRQITSRVSRVKKQITRVSPVKRQIVGGKYSSLRVTTSKKRRIRVKRKIEENSLVKGQIEKKSPVKRKIEENFENLIQKLEESDTNGQPKMVTKFALTSICMAFVLMLL